MGSKVAINGFGRIGRLVLRAAMKNKSALDFVSINDITSAETLAHLFKYDSVHGIFDGEVKVDGDNLVINGKKVAVTAIKDPAELPHKAHGVDIVIECTGLFRDKASAGKHIQAGAKKVLISAPAKDPDGTFVIGVNCAQYDKSKHHIISIGSCTTNCLAPVVKVLNDNFGLLHGVMTTIHSYTNDQRILDLPHKDLRRARSAAVSMIPTTTGAAKAISLVIPDVAGKLDGLSIRVPTPDASIVDLVATVGKDVTKDEVNAAMKKASESGSLKGYLQYCTDPIVSIDIVGNPHSSIFDSLLTSVMAKRMVKVFSWYDNEWGFSCRMVDMMERML
ncbi:MAG: type I glyceraldehyde-3-phosphate dehydrogenase [candidate division Zixibacteria bacterium]|nr:type I glyceraldehyde-3-phosphate dehydrogenase [candidate division Zixibacteria bacterium]MBU1469480.1 type I glyceraldehyde-3-phosphate dehydrogenase [candidate division Zixibacteria bacterium]MBU2624234.1 type I glyceraldehyde-3-phosphate dehydrogenase [candidate division Zixibacteria bacterium]